MNDYLTASKSNFKEFMNVSVDKDITFDILIDSNHVLNGDNKDNSNSLRNVIKVYGAILSRSLMTEPIRYL